MALFVKKLTGKTKDHYLDLILAFPLTSIKNDEHLDAAEKVLRDLLKKGDLSLGEELYLEALSDLIECYEDEHHPIGPASDAAMLQHLMEAKGISQADLHRETGIPKSTISEVLSGKKSFTRTLIRKLSEFFGVNKSVLSQNL